MFGQELDKPVPKLGRKGPRQYHGAEIMNNVHFIAKDAPRVSRQAVQPNAIDWRRSERPPLSPRDGAPPLFEILVLRPTEAFRYHQLLEAQEKANR